MNNFLGNSGNNLFNSSTNNFLGNLGIGDLDINRLLVILLLLTGQLNIEAIHVYRNNFAVTLGTFTQD